MGLFDDIADVYTGAKTLKQVDSPSNRSAASSNPLVLNAFKEASIRGSEERNRRRQNNQPPPPTQDQQVAQQIAQQQQKQADSTGITTLTDSDDTSNNKDEEKIIDKFGRFMAFGKPIKELSPLDLQKILDEVKLYQAGMPNYFEGIPGGLNFAKGFADSISQGTKRSGEFGGVEGSPTLQGLTEFIRDLDQDSNVLDAFKEAAPATYLDVYGLPATDAGLDFFANLSLDDDEFDKETQQKIIEARERLQDARSREAQNMGQGIMAASPALPGISVPAGGTISPTAGGIVSNPVLSPVAVGNMTPTTATGITPFNINQFYASLPQYTQQGIMAPTNLSRFTDALRMFPGATV